jgi:hypothetical protein
VNEQQSFVVGRSYGLQFHIEVGTELATEWGEEPASAPSLEALMGERVVGAESRGGQAPSATAAATSSALS